MRITTAKEYSEISMATTASPNIVTPLALLIKRPITATGQVGAIPPTVAAPREKLSLERYTDIATDRRSPHTIIIVGPTGAVGAQRQFRPTAVAMLKQKHSTDTKTEWIKRPITSEGGPHGLPIQMNM